MKKPEIISDEEIYEYAKDPEVRGYPIKSGWLTDEILEHIRDIATAQRDDTYKKTKSGIAYELFEEIICPMCYRLNPQHANMDNGKGCHYCKEREDWQALKSQLEESE